MNLSLALDGVKHRDLDGKRANSTRSRAIATHTTMPTLEGMKNPRTIWLSTALAVIGCGSGCGGGTKHEARDGGQDDQAQAVECHGTLSGAVQMNVTGCHIGWTRSPDNSVIGNVDHIDVSDEASVGTFGFNCKLPRGAATNGKYDDGNCELMLFQIEAGPSADRKSYMALYDEMNPANAQGSGSITIDGFELELPETGGITMWRLHGSASATMPAPKGASWSGQVDLALSF